MAVFLHRRVWAMALATLATVAAGRPLEFDDIAREGELRLLAERPDPEAYAYRAETWVDEESLRTGVVRVHTCHVRLDPNQRVVVLFSRERVQSIRITESEGIEQATVEGPRVELAGVQRGARLCVELRSRALDPVGEGRWRLHAGPLMRRYLDGYLPMQADLTLHWPAGLLRVAAVEPQPQPGVQLRVQDDGASLHLIFAGRLAARWELERP
ncbi:hypothetical protein [Tepidimonas charontis]|uniref:Uncharacterized protein n=1 Tax=Tepidimonas charontis TaxID=2267262 RepID=A0A554XK36_9BURK|nr:hypothetical protein [Tepidimonas charontis]TSE36190.1 hypothetical protein Tchar_00241 [Tepidimonas charontis]